MTAHLIAESGHSAELAARPFVIGSEAGVDIPIRADLGIAPRHYELSPCGDSYQMRALTPEWPVLINGAPVELALLRDGDVISAGALRLMFRLPQPTPVPSVPDTPPIMPVLGATVALPTMGARPQLKPLPPPPGESPADDAPRIGARLPGRMELPEDADTMEGFSESTKQRRRAEKLMKESLQRTQQRLEHLKVEQNFSLAVVVALVAVALGCVAFIYASRWTWKLYLVALAAIGYGIGWLIRISGKGIDRRFGYLAGIAGVASVLLANTVAWHGGMESHLGEESEAAEADSAEYAQESPEEKAARLRREEISREQEENRQKLYEAEFRETMRQQIKDHPELYEPDALEKLDQSLAEAAEDEKEYDAELAAEDEEPTPVDTTIHAIGLTLLFFGPRSIVAYFIIGGAAWRAAFRHLSNKEASDLHRGSVERSPDTSHLTLRERVQQGMN